MKLLKLLILGMILISACNYPIAAIPTPKNQQTPINNPTATLIFQQPTIAIHLSTLTPAGTAYHQGDTISYQTQPGDSLQGVTGRFQTTPAEILSLNPSLNTQSPMAYFAPGMTIQIKLNQEPNWGGSTALLPDYLFVNGPTEGSYNFKTIINQNKGWLKNYVDNSSGNHVTGIQIVRDISSNYSLSPRLVLALLEYQLHALSDPALPTSFSLGNNDATHRSFTSQISWMANTLNNGFYAWLDGRTSKLSDARLNHNPWQNSATTALLYYFSQVTPSTSAQPLNNNPEEFIQVYQKYFGTIDWNSDQVKNLLPAHLAQPKFILPFGPGDPWSYSGGPHSGWGEGDPLAAIDFAPSAEIAGCDPSPEWALAIADGVIARVDDGLVILDLNGNLNYQTGWAIQYLHLFPSSVPPIGTHLKQGDPIGHPSCAGVHATGRHVHIARLYNGVWISATETIPFDLDGWVASPGSQEYQGFLTRGGSQVSASIYGEHESLISADSRP